MAMFIPDDRNIMEVLGYITCRDFVTLVIRKLASMVRKQILSIEDETISSILQKGNELCRGRMIPMSPQLINKVTKIYKKCQWVEDDGKSTPLIEASHRGLADLVWGFIQCAKQTNTDLHKPNFWDPLSFLWLQNKGGETALSVAVFWDNLEVAHLLLNYASTKELTSLWNSRGTSLLPLLSDHPKHDGFSFEMLEKTKKDRQTSTSVSIGNQQEEAISYDERSWKYHFDKLDDGLLAQLQNQTTTLHLVSKLGYKKHVKDILEKDPSLIFSRNYEGETPAYISAREGHVDILESMITNLKGKNDDIESLLIRSVDKHNALHIAIQNHHVGVIFLLLEEIPQLANCVNDFNEGPLYLAAEREYFAILQQIMMKCKEKTYEGPNGKTALHAAAISNSPECCKYLLAEKPSLLYEKDQSGWTPLRYSVYYNNPSATRELLKVDYSIAYELMTQDGETTSAIHIAASRGHCETMQVLMEAAPGSPEFIDDKGRNILHVSVESNKTRVIKFIFQDKSLSGLINRKDINGNTPAHLLVASNFEMMERVIDSRVDINAFNNNKLTPLDITYSDEKREILIKGVGVSKGTNILKETSSLSLNESKSDHSYEIETEAEEKVLEARFKIVDNLVLVATLIATATFAAGFTMPGGFQSDDKDDVFKQGTPFLLKKSAFQAFVVSNAIAFSCSCSVLLGHIVLLIYRSNYDEAAGAYELYIENRIVVMYFLTGIALLAMLIAFVTGLYVVLTPSLGLAISICVMSLCFVLFSLKA